MTVSVDRGNKTAVVFVSLMTIFVGKRRGGVDVTLFCMIYLLNIFFLGAADVENGHAFKHFGETR
jgi:hypothetical protein